MEIRTKRCVDCNSGVGVKKSSFYHQAQQVQFKKIFFPMLMNEEKFEKTSASGQ